jgi:hypothetical protein
MTEVDKALEEMFGADSERPNATAAFKEGARMYLRARLDRVPFGFGGYKEGSPEFWDFFLGGGAAMDYMKAKGIADAAIAGARRTT